MLRISGDSAKGLGDSTCEAVVSRWRYRSLPPFALSAGAARRRRSGTLCLIAGFGALTLAISGCTGGGAPDLTPSAAPSPTVRRSLPPQTAMSREEFQQALSAVDAALKPGFDAIGAAQTPTDLANALGAVQLNLDAQAGVLGNLRPPRPEVASTGQVITALRDLSNDLATIATDTKDASVCTGGTGLPRASSVDGAQEFRLAFLALTTADPGHPYTFGTFLPAATADPARRPGTGQLPGGRSSGYGHLTVENQGTADSVVKVMSGGDLIRAVYVQAGGSATVTGIPNGTYDAYYTTGTDWDDGNRRFTRDCAFDKFDNPVDYTTSSTSTTIEYSVWTLTLHTSDLSNSAPTSPIDAGAFPAS
jgi:hypothetical protein